MAEKAENCAICGKKLGFWNGRQDLDDKEVCVQCHYDETRKARTQEENATDSEEIEMREEITGPYKVIPFVANVQANQGSETASRQLERIINKMSHEDWEYVRLESVQAAIAGDSGCFGIGATPPTMTSYSMIVFQKK